jgi:hypothetical protein
MTAGGIVLAQPGYADQSANGRGSGFSPPRPARRSFTYVAKLGFPISPSLTTSTPASTCFWTISVTADWTRAANAASSTGSPPT